MLKNKNLQIAEYETQCMGLIKIIEDQKKQINKLASVNSNPPSEREFTKRGYNKAADSNSADKVIEIENLKNTMISLKTEHISKQFTVITIIRPRS